MPAIEYPHPVLSSDSDDFDSSCKFELRLDESSQTVDQESIRLAAEYDLVCNGLYELVEEGSASVCLLVSCASTSYRKLFTFNTGETRKEIAIGKFDVAKTLSISCAILSTTEIRGYSLPDFNQDFFESAYFNLERGSLLAKSASFTLNIDDSELEKPIRSIFSVNRVDEQEADIIPDFEDEDTQKIEINLSTKTYELYSRIGDNYSKVFSQCLVGTVVMPVLVEALDILKKWKSEDDDEHLNYRWARAVDLKMGKLGLTLDDSSTTIASTLLNGIVFSSLNDFDQAILKGEEDSEGDAF